MDQEKITWTCVQAFTAVGGETAIKATQLVESAEGTVPVVCTPSGGAQTVRLQLPIEWVDQLSDEELLAAITARR